MPEFVRAARASDLEEGRGKIVWVSGTRIALSVNPPGTAQMRTRHTRLRIGAGTSASAGRSAGRPLGSLR